MNSIDLTPLYRSSVGFDRLGTILDHALSTESTTIGYPPYDIEVIDDNRYVISLAVAGLGENDLKLNVENGVLTIRGEKKQAKEEKNYLHQGIAHRSFERKFNLADYVEVTSADLKNGLLTITLIREIPEAMKPKSIAINQQDKTTLKHSEKEHSDNTQDKAA